MTAPTGPAPRNATPQGRASPNAPTTSTLPATKAANQPIVFVTYLGLKHGVNPDVPVPSPGNCPF